MPISIVVASPKPEKPLQISTSYIGNELEFFFTLVRFRSLPRVEMFLQAT